MPSGTTYPRSSQVAYDGQLSRVFTALDKLSHSLSQLPELTRDWTPVADLSALADRLESAAQFLERRL